MKLAVIDMLLLLEAIARFPIIGRLKSCSLADDTDALKIQCITRSSSRSVHAEIAMDRD